MATEIRTIPASDHSLAHYATDCPRCGMVLASTIQVNVSLDLAAHLAWHDRTGR